MYYSNYMIAMQQVIIVNILKKAKTALMAAGFPKFEAEKWSEMVKALERHFEKTT